MNEPPAADTVVSCLTPAGAGAIACLGLRGPAAWTIVRQLFRANSDTQLPVVPLIGSLWLGQLGDEVADQVVISVRESGSSPLVEIHCHGGREVVRVLEETFTRHGARRCSWYEFGRQTEDSPVRAAAAEALADALTTRTANVLLDQYAGALERALAAIAAALDRDRRAGGVNPLSSRDQREAHQALAQLVGYVPLGKHLTTPWRVVIAGAPNVGKSSLVNALAGYQRCIVSEVPGTTRDLVTTRIAVDGWPVEVIDTAGQRESGEGLEQQGIGLAQQAAAEADLCLWVVEAPALPTWPSSSRTVRTVINKIDCHPAWDLNQAPDAILVSARTRQGVPELVDALSRWLVPDVPPAGTAIPFTPHLCAAVEEAYQHLLSGQLEPCRHILRSLCENISR
jgi:tRNA modification GTPase